MAEDREDTPMPDRGGDEDEADPQRAEESNTEGTEPFTFICSDVGKLNHT